MEQIVPWAELCSVIEPHYPKAGSGRPAVGLERMLRMYFVRHWLNLADAACECPLLLRRFVGIDLGQERAPDATTLLKLGRLLQSQKLREASFAKVGAVLQANGLKVGTGQTWRPRSSARRVRRRTPTSSAAPRCTRRARASSGSSA